MKLKGIKKLKSELDVIVFLTKNNIPFEYQANGDIVIKSIETTDIRNERANMVSCFKRQNFETVGRHNRNNDLLFCNYNFTKLFGRNEFTPVQVCLTK